MKKTVSLLLIALFSFSASSAQKFEKRFTKIKENAIDFTNRTLIIVLKDEKKDINVKFNDYVRKAFESEWDLNDSIMYVSEQDFKKYKKDDSKAMIIHQKKSQYSYMIPTKQLFSIGNCGVKLPVHQHGFDFDDDTTLGNTYRQVQKIKQMVLNYTHIDPKNAMEMSKNVMRNGIDQRDLAESLKNMTLYIDKDNITDDFATNLDELYNYEYKLVTKTEIEQAIVENNEDIAFIENGFVIDADEGDAFIIFGAVNIADVYSNSSYNDKKLSLEDLKSLVEVID